MTTPANFIPNPNPDPIAIYLVNAPLPDDPLPDDPLLNDRAAGGAVPISGVVNFGLAVRNPAVDRDISDDTRPPPRPMRGRPATLRAWRRHRQRRLYPHGINLTLDYNPRNRPIGSWWPPAKAARRSPSASSYRTLPASRPTPRMWTAP